MREIHYISETINATAEKASKPKRVATYCRVSHEEDNQYGSLENQISYYAMLIDKNKDWVNARDILRTMQWQADEASH